MIFRFYSVRDSLTGFMTPVLEQNDAVAMRNFSMACEEQPKSSSLMSWKPDDFTLFCIGEFNSETGVISPFSPLQIVCSGASIKRANLLSKEDFVDGV